VVRDLDRIHGLGEEASHWLAIRALTFNAHFLACLLPGVPILQTAHEVRACRDAGSAGLLDVLAFAREDEAKHPAACLPHVWTVTSDSQAARVAVAAGADELVLLKSVTVPRGLSWDEAARQGHVDEAFGGLVSAGGLHVEVANLRAG